jgi:cardiolipin synthase
MFTRRRRTPKLNFDQDDLPDIENLMPTITGLTESTIYEGNSASIQQNGELFPSMLRDIDAARCSIHLETFVWWPGELERQFVEALCGKARAGVEVRLLIDAIGGARASSEKLKQLRDCGVQISIYCKPRPWNWRRFNQRTHRKLLIVDGHTGYTFGHGIGDPWLGRAQDPEHWRDTGIRLQGPVVHGLQGAFAENWVKETHCMLVGERCFPKLTPTGASKAHVVTSAASDMLSTVSVLYTIAIAAARREILIQNPYFAPDRDMAELLATAARRGVDVRLMIPGKYADHYIVRRAGCHLHKPLLQAGVRVYEYQQTFMHQKVMIVDDIWSHVGSTNFDSRSLELNDEISIGVLDTAIAAELKAAFKRDMQACDELTREIWSRRPRFQQLVDAALYQMHDQL